MSNPSSVPSMGRSRSRPAKVLITALATVLSALCMVAVAYAATAVTINFDGLAAATGQAAIDEVNASAAGTTFSAGNVDELTGYPRTDGANVIVLTTPLAADARFDFDQNLASVSVRIGAPPSSSLAAAYDAAGNLIDLDDTAAGSAILQLEADCIRSMVMENSSGAFLIDDLVLLPMDDDSQCDDDSDGVVNADDLCADTAAGVVDEPVSLKHNRFGTTAEGDFVSGNGTDSGFTIGDAGGCSMSQIIDAAGLGNGHRKFGLSLSELTNWVGQS